MRRQLVVYTVVIGEKRAVPRARKVAEVDWVVLTDIPGLRVAGWETLQVERVLEFDAPRSSRYPKMMPFEYFPDHSRSLYIDSNVKLTADPIELWEFLVGGDQEHDFGAAFQSFRSTLDQEFQAVRDLKLDSPASVESLYSLYLDLFEDALSDRVTWGGILARRHGVSEVERAMRDWFFITLRTSRRDQLTLPLALKNHPELRFNQVELDNRVSPFHTWPALNSPKNPTYRQFEFPDLEQSSAALTRENLLAQELLRVRKSEAAALRKLGQIYDSRSWRVVQFANKILNSVGNSRFS